MEKKYDIFISYRRKGGSHFASFLKIALRDKGINEDRIFLDTHSMYNTNDYEDYLTRAIEESANFIVIITPNSFLDEQKEKDVYLDEIAKALECGANIIPIFIDGINSFDKFTIPENLSAIKKVNGITYNNEYSNEFIEKLWSFLIINNPDTTSKAERSRFNLNIRSRGCAMSIVLLSFFCVVVVAGICTIPALSPFRIFNKKHTHLQDTITNLIVQDSIVCQDSISNDSIASRDSFIREEPSIHHEKKEPRKSTKAATKKVEQIKIDTSAIIQEKSDTESKIIEPPIPVEEEPVFVIVESMPEFPGGQQALLKYIRDNIDYPIIAQENGTQGRVICQFVVNKDGSIVDVEVVRSGGDPSLDKEAVRVIESMPKWKPGKQRGRAVRVKYSVPINFRLY